MKRGGVRAVWLAVGLLGCDSEPAETPSEPGPLAQAIHEQGEYPDEIEIAEAPRWTMATTQRLGVLLQGYSSSAGSGASAGGGTIIVRGQAVGGSAQAAGGATSVGGSPSGASVADGGTEQPSGGQTSEPEDGWDTDGWAEPEPAPAEVVALGGSGDGSSASVGASGIEVAVELEPSDCEADGPCPGGQPQSGGVQAGGELVAGGQITGELVAGEQVAGEQVAGEQAGGEQAVGGSTLDAGEPGTQGSDVQPDGRAQSSAVGQRSDDSRVGDGVGGAGQQRGSTEPDTPREPGGAAASSGEQRDTEDATPQTSGSAEPAEAEDERAAETRPSESNGGTQADESGDDTGESGGDEGEGEGDTGEGESGSEGESGGGTEEGDEGDEESESGEEGESEGESESESESESDDGAEEDEQEAASTDSPAGLPSRWWLWLLAGVALTIVIELILRRLLRPKPGQVVVVAAAQATADAAAPEAAATETPAVVSAEPTIDYDAEIQAMLDRTLRMLGWQPAGAQLAFTAREVVRSVAAGDARRAPAREVVRVAEQVRFAGVPADVTLYQRAKTAFESLTAVVNQPNSPPESPKSESPG